MSLNTWISRKTAMCDASGNDAHGKGFVNPVTYMARDTCLLI